MSNLKVGPYTFDRAHYDPEGDVLYLSHGGPEQGADFDETPDGHAISYDANGNLVSLTLIGVRTLVEGAHGDEEIRLALPKKTEPSTTDTGAPHAAPPLTSANLAPADVKLADLKQLVLAA
jgi:uncharacterized protein YuzE